ncbi:hypothetical protein ACIRG4_05035 [Streptomyces sp. NPDC102395]
MSTRNVVVFSLRPVAEGRQGPAVADDGCPDSASVLRGRLAG